MRHRYLYVRRQWRQDMLNHPVTTGNLVAYAVS